jgi:hypothetical protein
MGITGCLEGSSKGYDDVAIHIAIQFRIVLFEIRAEKRDANVGPKVACCEGRVEVPFRIERGRVIAGGAKFYPE